MIKDHHCARHCASQRGKIPDLMMIVPGVIGQAPLAQACHAPPEIRISIKAHRRAPGNAQCFGVRVAGAGMADAPETPFGSGLMRVQYLVQIVPAQIRMSDDRGYLRFLRRLRGAF